jgi:predicted DNA-binding transcriptional regulator AlpA
MDNTAADRRTLTGPEVDRRLGISRSTRRRLEVAGQLPRPVRLGSGRRLLRWLVTEIESYEARLAGGRGTP